tara:strand:+ start:157 stop:588 length:432 start_codon:yes stop_codon:yes gene_type:complete
MLTRADIKRIKDATHQPDPAKRIKELENSLSIALDINDNYQRDNKKLNEKIKEVEEALTKALAGDHRVAESDKIIMKKITEMKDLQKQKEDLQFKCMKAGRAIIELNVKYESSIKEIDRLSEENSNLKVLLKGAGGKNTNNNS